jgi:hypothetical protein
VGPGVVEIERYGNLRDIIPAGDFWPRPLSSHWSDRGYIVT